MNQPARNASLIFSPKLILSLRKFSEYGPTDQQLTKRYRFDHLKLLFIDQNETILLNDGVESSGLLDHIDFFEERDIEIFI